MLTSAPRYRHLAPVHLWQAPPLYRSAMERGPGGEAEYATYAYKAGRQNGIMVAP